MNYNEVVSSLRSLAREELRLKAVNALRAELLPVTCRKETVNKQTEEALAAFAKKTAVNEFKMAKLDDADPEKAEKIEKLTKENEAILKMVDETRKAAAEAIDSLTAQEKELNEAISKVQAGESKVCKEELNAVTDRLIQEVTGELAKEVAGKAV